MVEEKKIEASDSTKNDATSQENLKCMKTQIQRTVYSKVTGLTSPWLAVQKINSATVTKSLTQTISKKKTHSNIQDQSKLKQDLTGSKKTLNDKEGPEIQGIRGEHLRLQQQ